MKLIAKTIKLWKIKIKIDERFCNLTDEYSICNWHITKEHDHRQSITYKSYMNNLLHHELLVFNIQSSDVHRCSFLNIISRVSNFATRGREIMKLYSQKNILLEEKKKPIRLIKAWKHEDYKEKSSWTM